VHSLFFQLFVLNCPVLSRNLEKTRASYFLSVSKSTKLDALTLVPVGFQEAIRAEYPTLNTSRAIELPFLSNPQTNSPPIVMGQGLTYEFLDKAGKWKLVLSSDFIALSTMSYEKWEDFRSRLSTAIDLLVEHYSPSHFTRVGLRYQDLIIRSAG